MESDRMAPKVRCDLLLDEELVREARDYTANLSETVEQLLADFVAARTAQLTNAARQDGGRKAAAFIAAHNAFEEKYGDFADDFSPL